MNILFSSTETAGSYCNSVYQVCTRQPFQDIVKSDDIG